MNKDQNMSDKKMIAERVREILEDYLFDESESYAYISMYFENNKGEHNSKRLSYGRPTAITPDEFRDEPEGYNNEPDDGLLHTRTGSEMLIPVVKWMFVDGTPWDGKTTITQLREERLRKHDDKPLLVYDFFNPSDPYTFEAPDREVAALVVGVMGTAYGAETKDAEGQGVPVFIMGGYKEWYEETFGRAAEDGLEARRTELAAALKSFLYGRPGDRKLYKLAMTSISDPEKRRQYAEEWHNRRSSMTDFGKKAWTIGEKMAKEQG